MPYALMADAVLLLHFAVVVFVVGGLPAILIGGPRGWPWVRNATWRTAHAVAIVVVALQAWLGRLCPLTVLESWLRNQAGEATYQGSFIAHWLHAVLFFQAPMWAFATAYTAFGLLIAWAWWKWPPVWPSREEVYPQG